MRTDRITLTDHEIQNSLARLQHFLLQLDENINWDRVKKTLEPLDPSRKNVAGHDSYEPLKMFRIMLLQSWYDLSDPEMEFYLNTNLLFMSFCRFINASVMLAPCFRCDQRSRARKALPCMLTNQDGRGWQMIFELTEFTESDIAFK